MHHSKKNGNCKMWQHVSHPCFLHLKLDLCNPDFSDNTPMYILNYKDVLEASGCRIHPTYFSEVFHVDVLLIFGISKALLQNLKCAKQFIVICWRPRLLDDNGNCKVPGCGQRLTRRSQSWNPIAWYPERHGNMMSWNNTIIMRWYDMRWEYVCVI